MKRPLCYLSIGILTGLTGSVFGQLNPGVSPATFSFQAQDAPGEGFNDPTPASSLEPRIVGNNSGATLGELRRNVLVAAGERWSQFLRSNIPIIVSVEFEDQGGSEGGSITLAGASAATQVRNFANAPRTNILYPIALANSLAGRDLSGGPDIFVTVNSNAELSNSSSGNFTWYYGLDGNSPFGTIDFLNVIAHELGHGLGFAANVSSTSGAFFGGIPNSYTSFVFDTSLGLPWTELTNAERVNSARNDPNLTWNGPAVTNAVDGVRSFVTNGINSNQSVVFAATPASFGGSFPAAGITDSLILVDDGVGIENGNGAGTTADLAQPIINGADLVGNIALISRGIITFDQKVRQAEAAGAIAVVLYNNSGGDERFTATSTNPNPPSIPVTFISENSGDALLALLAEGAVTATVTSNRVEPQVTDESGALPIRRLRLFAPSEFNPGSSVSHWTTASSPNLLMEPSITRSIRADLDITPLLMKDIGWVTENVAIPHLTYETYLADLGLSLGAANLAPEADFDRDGLSNLEEYYFGSNLQQSDSAPFRIEAGQLVHQRAVTPNDLLVEHQTSDNLLNNFQRFPVTETLREVAPLLQEVRVPINTSAERGFFRLLIQQAPSN